MPAGSPSHALARALEESESEQENGGSRTGTRTSGGGGVGSGSGGGSGRGDAHGQGGGVEEAEENGRNGGGKGRVVVVRPGDLGENSLPSASRSVDPASMSGGRRRNVALRKFTGSSPSATLSNESRGVSFRLRASQERRLGESQSMIASSLGRSPMRSPSQHWLDESEFGVSIEPVTGVSSPSDSEVDEAEVSTHESVNRMQQPVADGRLPTTRDRRFDSVPPRDQSFSATPDNTTPLLASNQQDEKRKRPALRKRETVTVFGIASPMGEDPHNMTVEFPLFRWALRFCGMNPFARILTVRHILLKVIVAACVSCMIPWLWLPTITGDRANFVELETTFEWLAAVWMVLYGFSYWRKFHTLARLLEAIRTDDVARAFIKKLANRYQMMLIAVWVGGLGFYAAAELFVQQPQIDRRSSGRTTVEYVFACVGIPAFVTVFATVTVFYYFICHLHLIHIRRCRHLMGANMHMGDAIAFEETRAEFALCRDLTKQTAKQYERSCPPPPPPDSYDF